MRTVLFAASAAFALVLVPGSVFAQGTPDSPSAMGIVTLSKFKVPLGEDRARIMEFVDRVLAPEEKANPHVTGFHVLQHYYGADARDVAFVRFYESFADIEAPCGAPCETWLAENTPAEGTPEYDEMNALGETFMKYYSDHSDEIYSFPLNLSKN